MAKNQVGITFYERQVIEVRIRGKWGLRRIARYVGRNHGVVAREVTRNRRPDGVYSALYADARARERKERKRAGSWKIEGDVYLKRYIVQSIRDHQWSPEQVAGRLRASPPVELIRVGISPESIYRWIYTKEPWLYQYLRRKRRPKRTRRYSRKTREIRTLPERVSIHDRPAIIGNKDRLGDWESDSMKFRKQKTALSVQYERKSMLVRIHTVANLGKDETYRAITESIDSLPHGSWKSITFDNGGEGARHGEIRDTYRLHTFFCDPYTSWQKGGVENMNGLIRQYLPRNTNLATLSVDDIQALQEQLNNRPRKSLGYVTPNEFIQRERSYPPATGGALNG